LSDEDIFQAQTVDSQLRRRDQACQVQQAVKCRGKTQIVSHQAFNFDNQTGSPLLSRQDHAKAKWVNREGLSFGFLSLARLTTPNNDRLSSKKEESSVDKKDEEVLC
jgi:hypothetical protein